MKWLGVSKSAVVRSRVNASLARRPDPEKQSRLRAKMSGDADDDDQPKADPRFPKRSRPRPLLTTPEDNS